MGKQTQRQQRYAGVAGGGTRPQWARLRVVKLHPPFGSGRAELRAWKGRGDGGGTSLKSLNIVGTGREATGQCSPQGRHEAHKDGNLRASSLLLRR